MEKKNGLQMEFILIILQRQLEQVVNLVILKV